MLTTPPSPACGRPWSEAPLEELLAFLVDTQHRDLRDLLRSSGRTLENLCSRQPGENLISIRRVFLRLAGEVEAHLSKEEAVLFPAIERMRQAAIGRASTPATPFGSLHHPISMMEQEHNSAVVQLAAIRGLTRNYTLCDPGCEMLRLLSQVLHLLDVTLLENIALENEVLFPRARSLGSPHA